MVTKDSGSATQEIKTRRGVEESRHKVEVGRRYSLNDLQMLQRVINNSVRGDGSGARRTLEFFGIGVPLLKIKEGYSAAQLKALREAENVGPDKYGESLVEKFHKGAKTVEEHEAAQNKAYAALQEKIDKKAVEPGSIGSDLLNELQVSSEISTIPKTPEEAVSLVNQELDLFVERGYLTKEEAGDVKGEMNSYLPLYQKVYAEAGVAQAYLVTRDNARKLAYQIKRDKHAFTGSDHGNLHIIRGNLHFADQLVDSLKKQGVQVSDKSILLIKQAIYDHDLGYAVGASQAKYGFDAMKDHPLFSAKFLEENRAYYEKYFGKQEYDAIFYTVLHHSYPKGDLVGSLDQKTGINKEQIRSIVAGVDCIGVTAKDKIAALFQDPEAVKVLLKIRLAMEVMGKPDKRGNLVIDGELMNKYKKKLHSIAEKAEGADRKTAFHTAIDDFFSEVTVVRTLALYTGVVDSVGALKNEEGNVILNVGMSMSRIRAILGDMFGPVDIAIFRKAMGDQGLSEATIEEFGARIDQARRSNEQLLPIQLKGKKAQFIIQPTIKEDRPGDEYSDVSEVVKQAYDLSIRSDINSILGSIDTFQEVESARGKRMAEVARLKNRFIAGATSKTSAAELNQLTALTDALLSERGVTLPKAEIAAIFDKIALSDVKETQLGHIAGQLSNQEIPTVSLTPQDAKVVLRHYITQGERDFLGI